MDLSILSDFNDDDLLMMMSLTKTYTGDGSYAEPVPVEHDGDYENEYLFVPDMCGGNEEFSISNTRPTSWATAVIAAAQTSLNKEGITDELSLPYLEECLVKNMETEDRNVTDVIIRQFLQDYGLMTKEVYDSIGKEYLCEDTSANYRFTTEALSDINKSGLMNMINKGDPVIVLMALDLNTLKTVHSDVEHIYKGGAYQPSVYGIAYGYSMDNYWSVSMNVVPCENIRLHLPMTANETDANYAGIAGFAFSLKVDLSPPGTIPMYLYMNYDTDPTTQSFQIYRSTLKHNKRVLFEEIGKEGVYHTVNRVYVSPSYHYIRLADSVQDSWPQGVNLTIVFGEKQTTLTIASGKSLEGLIHPTKGFIESSEINEIASCSGIDLLPKDEIQYLSLNKQDACTDYTSNVLDLSGFTNLIGFSTSIKNFYTVDTFIAKDMEYLESIVLGYNTFAGTTGGSFTITNCPNLKTLYLEAGVATNFDSFELFNLPELEYVEFGIDGESGNNFRNAPMVFKGILWFVSLICRSSCSEILISEGWRFLRPRRCYSYGFTFTYCFTVRSSQPNHHCAWQECLPFTVHQFSDCCYAK